MFDAPARRTSAYARRLQALAVLIPISRALLNLNERIRRHYISGLVDFESFLILLILVGCGDLKNSFTHKKTGANASVFYFTSGGVLGLEKLVCDWWGGDK